MGLPEIGEDRFFPATAIERFGSVAVSAKAWTSFRSAASEVPEPRILARTDGRALCDACVAGQSRPEAIDQLIPWLRTRLLAADTLDSSTAIQWVEYWLHWFGERAALPISGAIASTERSGARIEKLYFDGPGTDDWSAFALHRNSFVPVFGASHVFIPGD